MVIVDTHCPGIAQFTGARLDSGLSVLHVLVDARASVNHPHSYRVYKGIVALGDPGGIAYNLLRQEAMRKIADSGTKCSYAEARLHWPALKDKEYD